MTRRELELPSSAARALLREPAWAQGLALALPWEPQVWELQVWELQA